MFLVGVVGGGLGWQFRTFLFFFPFFLHYQIPREDYKKAREDYKKGARRRPMFNSLPFLKNKKKEEEVKKGRHGLPILWQKEKRTKIRI
ncbi:MAG: hypothetical protein AAF639_29045 [Chloroflexota bacterium]